MKCSFEHFSELREAGYHVIEAFNADEAVMVLESVLPNIIISDVRMPGSLDGMALLAVVTRLFPNLPVIITSGHLQPTRALTDGAVQFIAKPYFAHEVVKVVQRELSKAK